MALDQREFKTTTSDDMMSPNPRLISKQNINATFGNTSADTELAVGYPVGFNTSTSKFAPWVAPDPSVLVVTLTGATGGAWTVTVNGATTAALAYNASAATVTAVLKAIGITAAVVKASAVYTITFSGDNEVTTLPTVTADISGVSGDISESATTTDGTQISAADLQPTSLIVDVGSATGGTWTITHGAQTTGNIAYNATPAAVEAALAALTTPSVVANCIKTDLTVFQIDFDSLTDLVTLPTVSATLTSLTGGTGENSLATAGVALVPDPTTLEIEIGTATGGAFTVTVNGKTTAAIDFDATTGEVVTAIAAIGHTVTCSLVSTAYTITFGDLPDLLDLPTVVGTITSLTGAVVGYAVTAGTATNGTNVIEGFVNPEVFSTDATNDVMGMIMVEGTIHASLPESLVDSGDVTALRTAMKDGLVGKGIIVQGLAGIH